MQGTSRDFARNLRALADWLDSKVEFKMQSIEARAPYNEFYEKDDFIAAVKAIGSGTKGEGLMDNYLKYKSTTTPKGTEFAFEINRSKVCKLVRPAQPAEYDCEPLLSHAEEAEIGE
jgi:hypothetical protein